MTRATAERKKAGAPQAIILRELRLASGSAQEVKHGGAEGLFQLLCPKGPEWRRLSSQSAHMARTRT